MRAFRAHWASMMMFHVDKITMQSFVALTLIFDDL